MRTTSWKTKFDKALDRDQQMSSAQEERTHTLVNEWEAEASDLRREIAELERQLQDKRNKLSSLTSQINAAMQSDSY